MALLHLLGSGEALSVLVVFVDVAEQLQDDVADREAGLVDVLLANAFVV